MAFLCFGFLSLYFCFLSAHTLFFLHKERNKKTAGLVYWVLLLWLRDNKCRLAAAVV